MQQQTTSPQSSSFSTSSSTSSASDAYNTLPDLLDHRVASTPDRTAFRDKNEMVTWREFGERRLALAASLAELGFKPGEVAAVMGHTTGEWAITDQAILSAGGIAVGVYPNLPASQVAFLLNDSGATVAFVGSCAELRVMRDAQKEAKSVRAIIGWGDAGTEADQSYDRLVEQGRAVLARDRQRIAKLKDTRGPNDTALLIYTSGTTGTPKGAMLSHRNCLSSVIHLAETANRALVDDRCVSFLPMAHVGEHVVGLYGRMLTGMSTYYVGSLDSQMVLSAITRERPTIFGSVPRIFEKAYAKIRSSVAEAKPTAQKIFAWAERVGVERSKLIEAKKPVPGLLELQYKIADRLVFQKIRAAFGGQVRYFVSGAAPIDPEILRFFHAAGMLVLEGYGLTETSGINTINTLDNFRFGTVGKPAPGVKLRIAEDGEILIGGPLAFLGYWKQPEATKETIDADGWVHTGDIGELDSDGFLRITDRKKNILITSGGKNIAPAAIEAGLTSEQICGPVVIIGDKRPYLTAIVTLDPVEARTLTGGGDLPMGELCKHPAIVERLRAAFVRTNQTLARHEQVKRIVILDRELTIESNELTPTMKVRRNQVLQKCAALVEKLYESKANDPVIEISSAL